MTQEQEKKEHSNLSIGFLKNFPSTDSPKLQEYNSK